MKKNIILHLITLCISVVFCSNLNAQNHDSTKTFLSAHFSKRHMYCFDEFYDNIGPFKKNYITSASLIIQTRLSGAKKYRLNAEYGVNFRYQTVNYNKATNSAPSITDDLNASQFLLGIHTGLSIERTVYTYKKTRIIVAAGITGTGMVYNNEHTKSFVYGFPNNLTKDSVVVVFSKNRNFYVNPYIQLGLKTAFKNKILTYGIRYIKVSYIDDTNIRYKFINTYFNDYKYIGRFVDIGNQVEFFLGISL